MTALESPFNPEITPELLKEVEQSFGALKVKFLVPLVDLNLHSVLSRCGKQERRVETLRLAEKALIREALSARDGNACVYCGIAFTGPDRTIDHVIPYRMVRSWGRTNLVLACEPCNTGKDDRIPAVLVPLLLSLVHQLVKLNKAPVERSLVPVGGAV